MYDEYTDWSDSFDDMDGGDWEYHMGGPDYEESEYWEKQMDSDDAYGSDYSYSSSNHDDDYGDDYEEQLIDNYETCDYREQEAEEMEIGITESEIADKTSLEDRQIEIIRWLEASAFAKILNGKEGFYILRGDQIELKDGSISDILDWLLKEGITGKKTISGYNTVYTKPGGRYSEKLTFFKNNSANGGKAPSTPVNFTRKIKILHRLSKSEFAVKLKKGDGFFVYRGNLVQLKDGSKVEILDWLSGEGIKSGKIICDYNIVGYSPDQPYLQKWTFFKLPPYHK